MSTRLDFELPLSPKAGQPAEDRGLRRDEVRMMVASGSTGQLTHTRFSFLPAFLEPGDLLVVNTSSTIPAAVDGVGSAGGQPLVIHLSTRLHDDIWVVEPRLPVGHGTAPWPREERGDPPRHVKLPGRRAHLELLEPYMGSRRLWIGHLRLPQRVLAWLDGYGRPIRYDHLDRPPPLSAYQNVYATDPGSAEMPSAGRPFTPEVITRLVSKGVGVTPVVLHTGVASLDAGEDPYPERVRVPAPTAERVNATTRSGGRVIAVGTTVVRALEAAVDPQTGDLGELDGWTDLMITPRSGVRAVNGLLTGWHEPQASHLLMLEAVAGRQLLERSYRAAVEEGYLWHEFGDVHLLLP